MATLDRLLTYHLNFKIISLKVHCSMCLEFNSTRPGIRAQNSLVDAAINRWRWLPLPFAAERFVLPCSSQKEKCASSQEIPAGMYLIRLSHQKNLQQIKIESRISVL
jgi:hypothetical protein